MVPNIVWSMKGLLESVCSACGEERAILLYTLWA